MRAILVPILCLLCAVSFAQPSGRVMLWDFEDGLDGWWANPWGGGKARVETVEGRYGQGLQGFWEEVPSGGNIVAPFLPDDAEWRGYGWTTVSFWLKGDGSKAQVTFSVMCMGPGGKEIGYSRQLPIDSTEWRHFSLDMRTFWNREKVAFDPSKIRRVIFNLSGTHQICVDSIALEAPQVALPITRKQNAGKLDFSPEAALLEGALLVKFEPKGIAGPGKAVANLAVPGVEPVSASADIAGPPDDDVRLTLPLPEGGSGASALSVAVTQDGAEAFTASYDLFMPGPGPALNTTLKLLPSPKVAVLADDEQPFAIPGKLVVTASGESESVSPVVDYFSAQVAQRCGMECERAQADGQEGRLLLTFSGEAAKPDADIPWEELGTRGDEAYFLTVRAEGATVAATGRRGLRYGAISLLHLMIEAQRDASGTVASCDITDWPSLPIRGITVPMPTDRWGYPNDAPVDPGMWEDFLLRTCLEQKLNTVVILVRQGMKYNRHPEVNGPAAWEQDTVRGIVETLKAHDINPVPLLDSLGHANWLVIPIKELREDGDTHTLCTRHPDAKRILLDCYQECIDVFQPTHFHMGLDEIRWQTFNKPEEERCSICRDVDKREIFVEQVNMLNEFLTGRGITPMMWGDMVLEQHNGRSPFYLDETLADLPRNIVITNWSITLDPLSNHLFKSLGFPVIQSNSRGVTPTQAPHVQGNFFGCWGKHPWVTETALGPTEQISYTYLSVLAGSEYSWNLHPDPMTVGVPLLDEFFEERMAALTRLGLTGPAGKLVPLKPPAFQNEWSETVPARGAWLTGDDLALKPAVDAPGVFPVGRKADSLYFLVSVDVDEEKSEDFYKRFRDKAAWEGVAVARIIVRYADGSEATRDVMHGVDVCNANKDRLPYAYNAMDYVKREDGGLCYGLQWVNAKPDQEITEIVFEHAGAEAQPMLMAVSASSGRSAQ